MNTTEFCKVYWRHYIALEKEFRNTIEYVSLEVENYYTFSEAYLKLILQICSEIDITLKFFCRLLDENFNGKKIFEYAQCIKSKYSKLFDQTVENMNLKEKIVPLKNLRNDTSKIDWWRVYNKIKHNRTDIVKIGSISQVSYKFANLKNTINALAALYQILMNIYYQLAKEEKEEILTPLPGSRFFTISGDFWDNITFYQDFALYIDVEEGNLMMKSSDIDY